MDGSWVGDRTDYLKRSLDRDALADDPYEQFRNWFNEAVADTTIIEPSAMHLATTGSNGRPSGRVVLLRGFDGRGLEFYTNYCSHKGLQIRQNPWAAATFWWPSQERQIRVEGAVEQLPAWESDAYFAARPVASQASAAVSAQSQVIPDRNTLEASMAKLLQAHPEGLPRPSHWGGYRLVPDMFEFWQGRPARLHDRFRYRREGECWIVERLAP
jgi:pyridoxamine 5'-phosphate oxidase